MTDKACLRQQAMEGLLTLIRKFSTDELLEEIANGDSQAMPDDVPRHLAALHDLRDTYDWSLKRQPDNSWHPCEPIELVSYAVGHHSHCAQAFCNALILLAKLQGSDKADMHFRWFKSPGEAWFRTLNDPWRESLLAGIAELHAEVSELEKQFWQTQDAKGKWMEPQDANHG